MNNTESEIENILRRAPSPGAPAGLKDKLLAAAPAAQRQASTTFSNPPPSSWFRRWWPALAPAAVSLACAAVLTVQQMEINDLKQTLQTLSPAITTAPSTPPATFTAAPSSSSPSTSGAHEDEFARLTKLAAQLKDDVSRLELLRGENEKLRAQIAAASANSLSAEELDAMNKARERALRIQCVNNLKQIGLAVRVWANDNADVFPTNWLCMSNELNTPKILHCPADTNRIAATTFSSFTDANCSYELFHGSETEPDQVLSRCSIHDNVGLCDGSVQMINPGRLVEKDGKLYLKRNP